MSLISEFHNMGSGRYVDDPNLIGIPTSWKGTGINPETASRDELVNAAQQLKKDVFEKTANQDTVKKSKGFLDKISQGAKSILKAAKKHKGATALIAVATAIIAGIAIKNKAKNDAKKTN